MARMTLVALLLVSCAVEAVICLDRINREKRQVTYHREDPHESDDDEDDHSIQPVTKKPLPTQVVYPGDLSGFYTTETPRESNGTNHRQRRSIFARRRSDVERGTRGGQKSLKNNKDMSSQESRLHSSYHKPSVSIMNDVPVEMSFDGAGFLRHEDEDSSNEQKDADFSSKPRKSGRGRPAKPINQENKNNRALDDFRRVFNLTRDRMPDQVKFDDEAGYHHQEHPAQFAKVPPSPPENNQEKVAEYGNQVAENSGTPFAVDFMTAYQNAYQNQFQNPFQAGAAAQFNYMPSQTTTAQSSPAYDPFTFNFPNIFNGQQQTVAGPGMNPMQGFNAMQQAMNPMGAIQNVNQIPGMSQGPTQVRDTGLNQETFMQNHRMPAMANPMNLQAIYQQSMPQQTYNPNQAYQQNGSPQSPGKSQRRKRSIQKNSDILPSASEVRRSSPPDQEDASSGFIPITGSFNGGALQLNFPFYGQPPVSQPSYSTRPVHSVPMYSMPIHPEGRQYGGGMEGYYHPSEARRFSYGLLGSGNFEVIRGGLFPGERQQSFNAYQDGRVAYGGNNYENQGGNYGNHGGNDYGNFGTTEIIIDEPIQGFQGFDNFPVNLINALSKHSEISVRSNHRDSDLHSV